MRELDPFRLEVVDDYELRARQIHESGQFGATYRDDSGNTHSYAHLAPVALEANEQLTLNLSGYSLRAAIRIALAARIERIKHHETWLEPYPDRLREARQSGQHGIALKTGKAIVYWDSKAGLARLCPDDAREEAMRLQRRTLPTLEQLQADGHQLTYAVLTTPNASRGSLRKEMAAIYQRFRALRKAKDADGEPMFPQIKGALCVLEAPLGLHHDWNVHLNVIFVTKGFFDWGKLRQHWFFDVHLKLLPKGPNAIRTALTELIKYAVASTVAKSAEHIEAGKTHAPPMLEWSDDELLEWLRAMRGFRRTRSYGVLYRLEKPEAEEIGPIVWCGTVSWQGGRYVHRHHLLNSIPEDKFSGRSAAERWLAFIRGLAPGALAGAGSLGETIPRLIAT